MDFGERIKEARRLAKMTQQQLADSVGIAKSTIAGYETNKRVPEYDILKNITSTLNVPCAYLLGEGIFSRIDWIDEHYKEILDHLIETLGDNFKKVEELTKEFSPTQKVLLLSSILSDIVVEENEGETKVDFYFYYDSPSYDDLIDLQAIYSKKFGSETIRNEKQWLDLRDFTGDERAQIIQFSNFVKQNRKE